MHGWVFAGVGNEAVQDLAALSQLLSTGKSSALRGPSGAEPWHFPPSPDLRGMLRHSGKKTRAIFTGIKSSLGSILPLCAAQQMERGLFSSPAQVLGNPKKNPCLSWGHCRATVGCGAEGVAALVAL